jgi:hypothetical protein
MHPIALIASFTMEMFKIDWLEAQGEPVRFTCYPPSIYPPSMRFASTIAFSLPKATF